MEIPDVPPQAALQRLLRGARITQVLYAAAKLGIADQLANGPKTSDELATATGAHPDALYRVLRALASLGVFEEREARRFALTPVGALLQSDHPDSMSAFTVFLGEEAYRAWDDLLYSVMTGAPAFDHVYGASHFAYLATHPEASAAFNQTMSDMSRRSASAVVTAYDFAEAGTIVDVGGGQGMLLAAILRAHPALRGVLMDQPHVVASAQAVLAEAGVAERCAVVGGDFFEEVPSGGDIYTLRRIIHDWDDERGSLILRSCARALGPGGKVLVIEDVVAPGSEALNTTFRDLQMLVMTGGRERTEAEYSRLFTASGLRLTRIIPTQADASIIESERDG